MSTNVVDSTNVNSLQPLSSLNLNAEHNGVQCIESLKPEDKGTERQFWFTAKMLCKIFDVAERTLRDNVESLIDDGEIAYCGISQYAIPGGNQRLYETTIYNLEVLNKLGMCCFRGNKKAKEIRNKFNDVLVKAETQAPMQLSETDTLMLQMYHCEDPLEFALITKKRDSLVHKIELKRSMTAIGKLGGITKARNVAIQERDAARQALDQKQQELEDVQTLYDEYREHIGEGVKRMSSTQLMKNYPHKFGMFKSAGSLTKFLKQQGVDNELSDVPDKSGYPYTIFDVEKALKVVS